MNTSRYAFTVVIYQLSIILYDLLFSYKEYGFNYNDLLSWYQRQIGGYVAIFIIAIFISSFVYIFMFFVRREIRFFMTLTIFFFIELFCMFFGHISFMI